MKQLIEQLKELRGQEYRQQSYVKNRQSVLEMRIEYTLLEDAKSELADIQAKLKQVDEQLREAALLEFATTGNKKPYSGVSVVINKVLEYSPTRAIRWAVRHAPNMLKLDTKAFEKHVRAVQDTLPVEFVRVSEQPSVRISKEL